MVPPPPDFTEQAVAFQAFVGERDALFSGSGRAKVSGGVLTLWGRPRTLFVWRKRKHEIPLNQIRDVAVSGRLVKFAVDEQPGMRVLRMKSRADAQLLAQSLPKRESVTWAQVKQDNEDFSRFMGESRPWVTISIIAVNIVIFAAIGFLFASILRLFVGDAEQLPPVTPEPAPTFAPTPVPTPPAQTNPAVAFVLTSIFWAVLIALVIAAFLFFLRERGYRLDFGRMQRSVSTLGEQARALWRRLRRRAKAMSHTLRERLRPPTDAAAPTAGPPPLDLGRRRAVTPREQIRAYYLAAVRRAGQSGVPRADNATPLEYVRELKEHWPEAEAELDELTEAFVEARYSPRPIDHPMVARVKAEWKRLRERLRRATPRS